MPSLEIIKSGWMTSIQDLGRKGLAYFAIPASGAMDQNAAKIANLLLGKNENSPLLECTSTAPHIIFRDPCNIILTGADFDWKINDAPVPRYVILTLKKNDVLRGKFAKDGLRGYLALEGTLEIPQVYHSFSTYTNAKLGGYAGRLLQKGDIIKWRSPDFDFSKNIIPILPGPEYDYLTDAEKRKLTNTTFTIGADSSRMGLRLAGEQLESTAYQLENSVPVLPGFIQLPPSGQPIIILQDGQTTGGYPRIAYIRDRYLSRLNQISLGREIRFKWADDYIYDQNHQP
ncbi:MAG: biotin-dependent carboxyltransferase family protein [Bacteroidota bacterium]